VLSPEEAAALVRLWLETPFEGGRHQRRVGKVDAAGSGTVAGEGRP
jgi:ribose 5-phosphate isomerase B